jgi:alkylation response protein AidB-like acyl-CoA dehydrogenase
MELRIRNKSTYLHEWQREMITIGMTEPNCGGFESLLTTAEDKGDHYVVNGQKHLSLTGICDDMAIVAVKTNNNTDKEG